MADPVATGRNNPFDAGGRPIPNGYQALVAFSEQPSLLVFEKAVTPPGWDGLEPIDITTMYNVRSRTKAPRHLIEAQNGSMRVGYDMDAWVTVDNLINQNQNITAWLPDGTSYAFWGWLKTWIPQEMEDGIFPEAEMEIVQSNWDSTNCVEAGAVLTIGTGTC